MCAVNKIFLYLYTLGTSASFMSDQQPAYQGEGYLSENYGFNMFVHIMVLIIGNHSLSSSDSSVGVTRKMNTKPPHVR